MFEELSQKLDTALGRFRQRGVLTEPMIREGLREVRRILLEADVQFGVTRTFLARVQDRALGEAVLRSVSPGQQIVAIVHEELSALLGEGKATLQWASSPPTVILVVGLQGSGKTTTAGKLAARLKREGRQPMLAACDLVRPAAIDQLTVLAERVGVPIYAGTPGGDPVATAREALERARQERASVLIVDTAGRLQIDTALMGELGRVRDAVRPHEILFVADAMTGQEAVNIATGFHEALGITGVVLTKMDGDARGGAALSIRSVVGQPIKFVGVGEGLGDLELADPGRLAGRILQQGDVVGLVERAQQAMADEDGEALQKKMLGKGKFTLEDFLLAMRQIQKMGPLEQLVKMIPGLGKKLPVAGMDPKRMKHVEAIVLSMTPEERRRPEILNGSRRARIARGSGRSVAEVNRLLKQFQEMQKMMKQMRNMRGMMPR
jgi:signal recognition particle subunit SRP54